MLADLARPILKPLAVHLFQRLRRDYGTEALENDEDVFWEVLWKLGKPASQFKGDSEAEAEVWLKRILTHRFAEIARKAERRAPLW